VKPFATVEWIVLVIKLIVLQELFGKLLSVFNVLAVICKYH